MKMNLIRGAVVVAMCGLSGAAFAQSPAKAVSPGKMTCAEFVALEDVYKPAIVYWATGVDKLGVRETEQLTVDTAHPVAAEVAEACKATPHVKIADKVSQLAKKGELSIYKH